MSKKIINLFQNCTVQEILCEAADMGLTEVLVVGRTQDRAYHLKKSGCSNTVELVGQLEMTKQWLLEQM